MLFSAHLTDANFWHFHGEKVFFFLLQQSVLHGNTESREKVFIILVKSWTPASFKCILSKFYEFLVLENKEMAVSEYFYSIYIVL